MKRLFYSAITIALVSTTVFMDSCKKTASVNGQIKSRTETYTDANGQVSTGTTNYTYDGQGRQVLAQSTTGNSTVTAYGNGSVTQTTGTTVTTYQLNSSGQAISDNSGFTYVYDNNGFLTSETSGPTNSETFTISNSNVTNSAINQNGTTTNFTYTYLSNQDYRNFGISFLGKRSVNLISTDLASQGGNTTSYTYNYVYDGQGRILQLTISGGNTTDVYTYTYSS